MTMKTYAPPASTDSGTHSPSQQSKQGTLARTSLAGRDLCSIRDLSASEVRLILDTAHAVKAEPGQYRHALQSKQLVMFFEKDSLRTRLTFETGINILFQKYIF